MPIEYIALLIWFYCTILCAGLAVLSCCYPPKRTRFLISQPIPIDMASAYLEGLNQHLKIANENLGAANKYIDNALAAISETKTPLLLAQWVSRDPLPYGVPEEERHYTPTGEFYVEWPSGGSWQCGKCNKWFVGARPERVVQNNGHTMRFITCNDCADKMLKDMERPHKVEYPHYNGNGHNGDSYRYDNLTLTVTYDGQDIGTFDTYSKRGEVKAAMSKYMEGSGKNKYCINAPWTEIYCPDGSIKLYKEVI